MTSASKFALLLLASVLAPAVPVEAQAVVEAVARRVPPSFTPSGFTLGSALTPDGRFLLVDSSAPDIVPGQLDSNGTVDVFVRDRQTEGAGATSLISAVQGSTVRSANGPSLAQGISNDGRFVLFQSGATDLIAPGLDANGAWDLFLYDRQLEELHLVSRQAADPARTAESGGGQDNAVLSADGRYVAFGSPSDDLVAGFEDNNEGGKNVFLFDRVAATVSLVSRSFGSSTAGAANGESLARAISADGRYVLYDSLAIDLVAGYVNSGTTQVYRFDRTTGLSVLVSHATTGAVTGSNHYARSVALSPDGRWALFESSATDLVAGTDTNNLADVFLADLDTGAITLVSHASIAATTAGNHSSHPRAVSPDGRWVLFDSVATDLIAGIGDTNDSKDVFLFDRQDASLRLVSRAASSATSTAAGPSLASTLSDDGRIVSFWSVAGNLAGTDNNGQNDVFIWNRTSGTIALQSTRRGSATAPASGSSTGGLASADGSVLLFNSTAPDLDPPDLNTRSDVFEPTGVANFHRTAISRQGAVATTLPTGSESARMTPDGRFFLVFARGEQLFAGAVAGSERIVAVYDRFGHSWDLVSHPHDATNQVPNAASFPSAISTHGRFVVFDSLATDLIPAFVPAGFGESVFRYDRVTREAILVSHAAGLTNEGANSNSLGDAISADGRWIVFSSSGSNLVPGQSGGSGLMLYDAQSRAAQIVNHAFGSPTTVANHVSDFVAASPDGRFVLYDSEASNLVAGDANGFTDVFLYDRATGQNQAISVRASDPAMTSNGISDGWVLTPEGRYVLFASTGTDLVTGLTGPPALNAYLRDRVAGTTTLISHASGQPTTKANGHSWPVAASADGRLVLLASEATDLLPTSLGPAGTVDIQVYLYDRQAGTARLLSHALGQPLVPGDMRSIPGALSASGHVALFSSRATNLDGAVPPGASDHLFAVDLATGTRRRITVTEADPSRPVGFSSTATQLSADGNTVLFESLADTLVLGDSNQVSDAFLSSTTILSDGFESGDTSRWSFSSHFVP